MEWYIYNSQIIMRIIPLIYEDSQNRLQILKLLRKVASSQESKQGG